MNEIRPYPTRRVDLGEANCISRRLYYLWRLAASLKTLLPIRTDPHELYDMDDIQEKLFR